MTKENPIGMKNLLLFLSLSFAFVLFNSCGSSSSSDGDEGSGLGDATEVTGTALAPNGTDPVSGATVFIEGSSASSLKRSVSHIVQATCDGETVECDDPTEDSCATTCTCSDGTYTLDVTSCSDDSTTIQWCKGSICGSATLDCADNPTSCTANIVGSTTSGSTANIAVVTGAFDEIENVLAKLGFGEVDGEGLLEIGSEDFDIYKCGGGRDTDYEVEDPDEATYKPCSELFSSVDTMNDYDIIFINCGASESPESSSLIKALVESGGTYYAHSQSHQLTKALSSDTISNIQDYVDGGGRLYVTDWAYDYIEQSHPSFMKFEGDPDSSSTAGDQDDAQLGTSGITSEATINNDGMSDWIQESSITTNTIDDSSTPGESCDTTAGGNSGSDNLNSDGTIRIGDFLPAWAVMESVHSDVSPEPFIWIEGLVSFTGSSSTTRPLTVSQEVGDNNGCILYSSYHTSHSCPTTGFWPQERILQYLIFETAGSCTPE